MESYSSGFLKGHTNCQNLLVGLKFTFTDLRTYVTSRFRQIVWAIALPLDSLLLRGVSAGPCFCLQARRPKSGSCTDATQ